MHDFLNRELVSVRREDTPMGLIVCNLDDFKRVNDRFGHHCGDQVLAEIAALLLQPLSNTDIVVRYDGAEFVIFLPGLGVLQAHSMAETLGRSIRLYDSTVADHAFSASFGVTEYRDKDTPDSLLQRGYQCLYRAQARGKNQCAHDGG
jgi:diguanylate cyclase (GGDEF)-like protein